jgi:hypothetical protein
VRKDEGWGGIGAGNPVGNIGRRSLVTACQSSTINPAEMRSRATLSASLKLSNKPIAVFMIVSLNNHGERRCPVLDLFGQHVAGFHIRNQQDIGVSLRPMRVAVKFASLLVVLTDGPLPSSRRRDRTIRGLTSWHPFSILIACPMRWSRFGRDALDLVTIYDVAY